MFPSFPWLPPEINSALMFSGAGSGPLFTASSAWSNLAADLSGAASSFNSVVTGMSNGAWAGPASMSMAAAAVPYVSWLNAAAAQAEAAGAQALAAASGFETALAATVTPAAVTANRSQLATLVATNFLGQNTPAIFATEFEYVEMWAQDVAAMFGYHGAATAAAAMLPAFSAPPNLLAGLSSLGGVLTAPLTGMASSLGSAGSAVMSSGVLAPVTGVISSLEANPALLSVAEMGMYPLSMMMSPMMMLANMAMRGGAGAGVGAGAAASLAGAPKFVGDVTPKGLGGAGLGGLGAASAGLSKARLVGAMSVPPTWQGSSPARMVSAAMSGVGAEMPAGAAAAMPAGGGGGMPMMPMPMGGAGAAAGGMPLGRGGASPNHVTQSRPSVIPRTGVG
ncbi:PPE family protein [Mycobacterium sp. Lab-001]|uniref:PPE family protein n=1 Tax=Mycobacterium sp. Lab-001 TaxID=3410136 RepID=UPI003D176BAE